MSPRQVKEVVMAKPMLLPPAKDKCQECAVDHLPHMPHDATSLYYLVKFKMEHEREATWEDAMSHCVEEVKVAWREGLRRVGIDSTSTQVRGGRDARTAKKTTSVNK